MAEEIKFDDQSLLDVGTGAGFPGIPLKIVFEDLFVTLLEPTLKRVNFLDIVIKEIKKIWYNARYNNIAKKVLGFKSPALNTLLKNAQSSCLSFHP